MPIKTVINKGMPVKAWTDKIEETALRQLENLSQLPFIHKHVAVMPDIHTGYGSTVGSVIPTKGAIVPALVGVDLFCGMCAVRTSLTANDLPDSLGVVQSEIEASVPHGRTENGKPGLDKGGWKDIPSDVELDFLNLTEELHDILFYHPKIIRNGNGHKRALHHLGTLGTGNHFIELCLDESDNVWIMLHSGSRGIGNAIGSYFIELAKQDMRKWFINLPDIDLAYLPEGTDHFTWYTIALNWAGKYAALNRSIMMRNIIKAMRLTLPPFELTEEAVNIHHNYCERENHFGANVWVTRKGAIRARKGDLGIIPGSMGAKSYIVEGLGNPESFCSASHGAGRVMSRGKARATFTVKDLEEQTKGIACRKDEGVLDEIPSAYKPIDEVMANPTDLVKVRHTLRQIVNVKG